MWLYPDGSRVLELSTRCATNEAFQVAAESRAFLAEDRRRPLGRAADEDPQGAEVLREARAAGCVTRRYAAIDVGTNSVKLNVGELSTTVSGGRSSTAPR